MVLVFQVSRNSKIIHVKIIQGTTWNNVAIYEDAYDFASNSGTIVTTKEETSFIME
ncbi:MAG: hypothetical protein ACI91R_001288 [Vicingaceae bacterium]|jgi:hypothetical protein